MSSTMTRAMDGALKAARGAKVAAVAEDPEGEGNLASMIAVFRGDELVAQVFAPAAGSSGLLALADRAASGFSADVLAIVFETWGSLILNNPLTGKGWQHGEMGEVAEHHDGRAKGWVVDALLVTACNRAGDLSSAQLPYRVTDDRVVEWLTPIDSTEVDFTGYMPDTLREIMAQPTIMQSMARQYGGRPEFADLSIEEKLAMGDCTIALLLMGVTPEGVTLPDEFPRAFVVLAAPAGSEREQVIEKLIPRWMAGEWPTIGEDE